MVNNSLFWGILGLTFALVLLALPNNARAQDICPPPVASANRIDSSDIYLGEGVCEADGLATVFIAIRPARGRNPKPFCSGVKIGSKRILTAAHCMFTCPSPCDLVVGFGPSASNVFSLIPVIRYHLHPKFLGWATLPGNDYAVLQLSDEPSDPGHQQNARVLYAGSFIEQRRRNLTVSGYGISEISDPRKAGVLYANNVPVASHACLEAHAPSLGCHAFREFILSDPTLPPDRAGDTCGGDSGGPASVPDRVPRVVVGITSRALVADLGSRCGRGGIYGLIGTVPTLKWLLGLVPDLRIVTRW